MSTPLSILVEISQWFQSYWMRRREVLNKAGGENYSLKNLPWEVRLETGNASIVYLSASSTFSR